MAAQLQSVCQTITLAADHAVYQTHFPGFPCTPGSLVCDCCVRLAETTQPGWKVLALRRFRFKSFLAPGSYVFTLEPQGEGCLRCRVLVPDTQRCAAEGLLDLAFSGTAKNLFEETP